MSMSGLLLKYIFVIAVLFISGIRSQSTYHASVVEYSPNRNYSLTAEERLNINTKNYIDIIKNITKNEDMDLIVFPESSLMDSSIFSISTYVPSLYDVVLCNSTIEFYASFLKNFSCAAIENNVTIVINFTEKDICYSNVDCNDWNEIFYNTDVVISTNGSIIARYRKFNLFGEYGKSKPKTVDLPVFEINNSSIGIMTCFDIQFQTPGFNLVREKEVKNIIFPLNWISELPYLTALQTQQMWAQEMNVVLLASGCSYPAAGAGGSGIFLGKYGPLEHAMLGTRGTKVISQQVPIDINVNSALNKPNTSDDDTDTIAQTMDDFFMLVDPSITDHNFLVLNASKNHIFETVCHGDEDNTLCCDFNISLTLATGSSEEKYIYSYLLVVFSGIRTYSGLYYGGVDTCGIVACLNESISSCGQRFKNYSNITWPVIFTSINISGNFSYSDQQIQFPTTLLSSIRPLPIADYFWNQQLQDYINIRTIGLTKPQNRLLTFGIFGRDFSKDWDPLRNDTTNNSGTIKNTFTIFLLMLVLHISYLL